jgi:dTDP-glucose pyrophosphorylase
MIVDIEKHIIKDNETIRTALMQLNRLSNDLLTLFVIDENGCMLGTVTDGDIRRRLVISPYLEQPIIYAAHKNYSYINEEEIDIHKIRTYRAKGIVLLPCLNSQNQIIGIYNIKENRSILPIDAVLMAGGKGERLRPLTENTPKPLLRVGDKAIIDYNVDRLLYYGINHISVTVNYLHEQIEEHFREKRANVKVNCVCEPQYLGTIGSVKFVDAFFNDTVLVMNSDLFTNIDYEDFYLHYKKHNADMSVAAVPYSIAVPYGIFDLAERNIYGIKEKPIYNYYANAGVYLIKKELLNLIPNGVSYNATDFIKTLISQKRTVIRFPITGYWIDIGKHEDYKKAQELVKHMIR